MDRPGVDVTASDGLPIEAFGTPAAWREWLEEHHATLKGVWLRLARKSSGIESISHDEAVDVALCYGWIDGKAKPYDETSWLQRFTPRTRKSKWSRINRDKATRYIEQGLMRPAGLREVQRAMADGRWDAAYASQAIAEVPEDLQRELDNNAAAGAFFERLSSRNRYAILYRIQDAKKPETRQRRIQSFVVMLAEGRKIYP